MNSESPNLAELYREFGVDETLELLLEDEVLDVIVRDTEGLVWFTASQLTGSGMCDVVSSSCFNSESVSVDDDEGGHSLHSVMAFCAEWVQWDGMEKLNRFGSVTSVHSVDGAEGDALETSSAEMD